MTLSQELRIIGNIWLVGSFGLPIFLPWYARIPIVLIGCAFLFQASRAARREAHA